MANSIYRPKSVDQLTFTDNGMFQAVLHEPGVCAELVERLLGLRIKKVEYPELEKTIAPYYISKGVRLDVYLKDVDKIINVELQSQPQEALGKRTRYYQSMIDCDSLIKGDDYAKLKESYILFICKYDPFNNGSGQNFGLSRYTFRNVCDEEKNVNLDDKCLKVMYNATAYKKERDEKVRAFLKFVCTNDPGEDEYSNNLFAAVEKLKDNEKFRQEYAAMNIHEMDLRREAKKEKAIEDARNFYANGVSVEIIAKSLNMTVEQVKEIVNDGESEAEAQTN
ncbi:MAG: Rpn family recombination-promoting nuclease/putative transposase [Treponema sp.]|nr:Rpn family recombination-promoting nuclease/putative transposase [Treponema sp.]